MTDDSNIAKTMLAQIDAALQSGTYRVGDWQKLLRDPSSRQLPSADVTRVSNRLHRRNGFVEVPFLLAYVAEWLLFFAALALMASEGVLLRLAGLVALALCLQPLMKVSVGLLLGVRYSYAFLWYFEPRFKMAYGSYLQCSRMRQALFQLSGCFGTPLALAVGGLLFADLPPLAWLCLAGAAGAALMQVAAFVAAWKGVRKLGPFYLGTLTTPATLAMILRG